MENRRQDRYYSRSWLFRDAGFGTGGKCPKSGRRLTCSKWTCEAARPAANPLRQDQHDHDPAYTTFLHAYRLGQQRPGTSGSSRWTRRRDRQHGGTFAGMLAALDTVLAIAGPDTRLLPGHGTIVDRTALVAYRNMITDIKSRVSSMVTAGKTKQEVLAAHLTADYDSGTPGGNEALPAGLGTSANRFIAALYDELKQAAQ